MPRDNNARVRLLYLDMEGSNEAIQDNIRAIVSAIKPTTVVMRNITPGQESLAGNGGLPTLEEHSQPIEEDIPLVAKKVVKTKRAYYSPNVLPDLDLNSGELSFEVYCNSKNPQSTNKKYLVIADWLKEHRGIPRKRPPPPLPRVSARSAMTRLPGAARQRRCPRAGRKGERSRAGLRCLPL